MDEPVERNPTSVASEAPPIYARWATADQIKGVERRLCVAVWPDGVLLCSQQQYEPHTYDVLRIDPESLRRLVAHVESTVKSVKSDQRYLVPSGRRASAMMRSGGALWSGKWDEVVRRNYGPFINPTDEFRDFSEAWTKAALLAEMGGKRDQDLQTILDTTGSFRGFDPKKPLQSTWFTKVEP